MWKWTFGILLSIVASAPLYAQCPGGSCPSGGCPQGQPPISIDIGDLPTIGAQQGEYGPAKHEGALLSVVRIVGVEGPGSMVKGSGTYVSYEELYCVVTASHVVRGTHKLYVVFRDNEDARTVQGVVLSNDQTNDVAVLGLYQHPADGEEIAAAVAYSADIASIKNEILRNYGFGGDDTFCGGAGRVVGEFGPSGGMPNSWYEISSAARLGDSGGPVFLPSGKLAGVLWGRDARSIAVVKTNYIHAALRTAKAQVGVEPTQMVQPRPLPRQPKKLVPVLPIKPPVLPWRDKIENEIDGLKRAPKVQPTPPNIGVDVNVNPAPKPVTPEIKDDERVRVDRHIAIPCICAAIMVGMVVGFLYQWKKSYVVK